MTKIKVSETTPLQLDWLVAKALEITVRVVRGRVIYGRNDQEGTSEFRPHANWLQGGPIIEREFISVSAPVGPSTTPWQAEMERLTADDDDYNYGLATGPTPLIAAMRCFVASKLGDEVEIPEDLK